MTLPHPIWRGLCGAALLALLGLVWGDGTDRGRVETPARPPTSGGGLACLEGPRPLAGKAPGPAMSGVAPPRPDPAGVCRTDLFR